MKLKNVFSILLGLYDAILIATKPTVVDIYHRPLLLLQPTTLHNLFMYHLWAVMGDGIDSRIKDVKSHLITDKAKGVVLDIGAGYGHTALYLNPTKVTEYIALEPNTLMHPQILKRALSAGFTPPHIHILPLGIESPDLIWAALRSNHIISSSSYKQPIDTIISILTLCTVPNPQATIPVFLDKLLKPGGRFLYVEHVRDGERDDIAWWQWFWNPVWGIVFGGCGMDRRTDVWVDEWKGWERDESDCAWAEGDDEIGDDERMFRHKVGSYVKARKLA